MARLPVYTNQTGLDIGSDTFRLAPNTGAAIATGLQQFGAGLTSAGEQLGKAQNKADADFAAKLERLAKRDEHVAIENEVLNYKNALQADLGARANEYDPASKEKLTPAFERKAIETADEIVRQRFAKSERRGELELALRKVREGFTDKAAETEYTAKMKNIDSLAQRKVSDVSEVVRAQPEALQAGIEEAYRFADGLELSPQATVTIKRQFAYRIEQARLQGLAEQDPQKVVSVLGKHLSGGPSLNVNPVAREVIEASKSVEGGIDTGTLLTIAQLESGLDPKTVPRLKNGTLASSAKGVFQVIDGVARSWGIDPKDTVGSARAVSKHLGDHKTWLEARGIEATPGRIYLGWLLGAPAARAVLSSPETTPTGAALGKVWSQGLIGKALDGNPAFFGNGRGRTVGALVQRAEELMAYHGRKVAPMLNGADAALSDNGKAIATELLGQEPQAVTFTDLRSAYDNAVKVLRKSDAGVQDVREGLALIHGEEHFDPTEPSAKKKVDAAIRASGANERILTATDTAELSQMAAETVAIAERLNYIPAPVANALATRVNTGTTESKVVAYEALGRLTADHDLAVRNSKIDGETETRVKKYVALTQITGLDPNVAIERIERQSTDEYKASLKALEKTRELGKLKEGRTWSELTGSDDTSIWSNPAGMTQGQQAALLKQYRDNFEFHMIETGDMETAKALAQKDVHRTHGVSTIFGGQRFMAFPPEKYVPNVGPGGKAWVVEQAAEDVKRANNGKDVSVSNIFLVPRGHTAEAVAARRLPSYDLVFRDENGILQRVPETFTPAPSKAVEAAREKAEGEFRAARGRSEARRDFEDMIEAPVRAAVDAVRTSPSPKELGGIIRRQLSGKSE